MSNPITFKLMLVTEPSPNLLDIVAAAVAGGVDCVQFRDKSLGLAALIELGAQLRQLVPSDFPLIVNGSWTAANAIDADGVNLPEGTDAETFRQAREAGREFLVGASVHGAAGALFAEANGADYVVAGTVFESRSHPGHAGAGTKYLTQLADTISIPVIAIGGITPSTVGECLAAGASGIAVLSAIMLANDPRAAARAFADAIEEAKRDMRGATSRNRAQLAHHP